MALETLYKQFNNEIKKASDEEKAFQRHKQAFQQLSSQKAENEAVKEDLSELTEDNIIYKLIGPALVKEDLTVARETVEKRLKFIQDEIHRNEKLLKDSEDSINKQREKVVKIQEQLIAMQNPHK
ncbi:hypothetical protein Ciccas_000766 [Cichlidogyrus casuarinus]|uniref:Prefoldin subunit 6 n=1 Tax=Cichlidogyrus casuarinus TaxID=1844966 RepID=A0ABD2QMF1_9PLAT